MKLVSGMKWAAEATLSLGAAYIGAKALLQLTSTAEKVMRFVATKRYSTTPLTPQPKKTFGPSSFPPGKGIEDKVNKENDDSKKLENNVLSTNSAEKKSRTKVENQLPINIGDDEKDGGDPTKKDLLNFDDVPGIGSNNKKEIISDDENVKKNVKQKVIPKSNLMNWNNVRDSAYSLLMWTTGAFITSVAMSFINVEVANRVLQYCSPLQLNQRVHPLLTAFGVHK